MQAGLLVEGRLQRCSVAELGHGDIFMLFTSRCFPKRPSQHITEIPAQNCLLYSTIHNMVSNPMSRNSEMDKETVK